MTSNIPPAVSKTRHSYRGLSRLTAWRLLDDQRRVVASVRASTVEEARRIFQSYGLDGVWIRRERR